MINCPAQRTYTDAEWRNLEKAVDALPDNSPLIPVLQDYLDYRDECAVGA
jgi:hypothetical protein